MNNFYPCTPIRNFTIEGFKYGFNFVPCCEPFSYFYYGNPLLKNKYVVPQMRIPVTEQSSPVGSSPQISPRSDLSYSAAPYSPSESFFELSDSDDTMEEIEPLRQITFEQTPNAPHPRRRKRTFKKFI